jgi:hypothetical protein
MPREAASSNATGRPRRGNRRADAALGANAAGRGAIGAHRGRARHWQIPRLIKEFHGRLRDKPHTWVEWSCSQLLQNTPLHPIAEWGRQRFGGARAAAKVLEPMPKFGPGQQVSYYSSHQFEKDAIHPVQNVPTSEISKGIGTDHKVVFLYYLHYVLGYEWAAIVHAGAPTLEQTYIAANMPNAAKHALDLFIPPPYTSKLVVTPVTVVTSLLSG